MRSSNLPEYAGRIRRVENHPYAPISVTLEDIREQRARAWVGHHPEDYCHRCGKGNVSWYTSASTWDPVMRADRSFGQWEEIICMACFIELAGPGRSWTIEHDGASYRLIDQAFDSAM